MRRHLAALFIAFVDMLVCALIYALAAISPTQAKVDGVKPAAEFLITTNWDINRNTDLDQWVVTPSRRPVFYQSRQVGCADLDRDSLGFSTEMVTLADGSEVRGKSYTETTSLRCIEPGHYDIGVNRFSDHDGGADKPIIAHVEITKLNPTVSTIWVGDVVIDHVGQTVNAVSFDLDKDGNAKLVSVPLESVTAAYEKARPGGAP